MNDKEFIKAIRSEIIEENLQAYRKMFPTDPTEVNDPYGKLVVKLYRELNSSQREALFCILRQTTVDTLSSVFGLFDGVCIMENLCGDFELSMDGQSLAGDLQDLLLEAEEEME